MGCIGIHPWKVWTKTISEMSNTELVATIAGKGSGGDWYIHQHKEHRGYMRLLKQEAHRRGLGT